VKPLIKRTILYGALLTALGATAMQYFEEPASAGSTVRAGSPTAQGVRPSPQPADSLAIAKMDREFVVTDPTDPFAGKSWATVQEPVVPASPAPPPPVPTAPALPFEYAGKLEVESGKWIIYLARGDQSFAVSKGDVFDNAYRFDGIEGNKLIIVYLPLGTKQFLPVGKDTSE
jgi:hypothetical protein